MDNHRLLEFEIGFEVAAVSNVGVKMPFPKELLKLLVERRDIYFSPAASKIEIKIEEDDPWEILVNETACKISHKDISMLMSKETLLKMLDTIQDSDIMVKETTQRGGCCGQTGWKPVKPKPPEKGDSNGQDVAGSTGT